MTAQSEDIRRVGGAFVVFDPNRIIPLFVASRYRPRNADDLAVKAFCSSLLRAGLNASEG